MYDLVQFRPLRIERNEVVDPHDFLSEPLSIRGRKTPPKLKALHEIEVADFVAHQVRYTQWIRFLLPGEMPQTSNPASDTHSRSFGCKFWCKESKQVRFGLTLGEVSSLKLY